MLWELWQPCGCTEVQTAGCARVSDLGCSGLGALRPPSSQMLPLGPKNGVGACTVGERPQERAVCEHQAGLQGDARRLLAVARVGLAPSPPLLALASPSPAIPSLAPDPGWRRLLDRAGSSSRGSGARRWRDLLAEQPEWDGKGLPSSPSTWEARDGSRRKGCGEREPATPGWDPASAGT